jgi:hypothetical protein
MNADLIIREAHLLLQEIAGYEEPRLFMEDTPTLAELAKKAPDTSEGKYGDTSRKIKSYAPVAHTNRPLQESPKGHVSDIPKDGSQTSTRQDAIMAILHSKGPSYIKDISTLIRDVSEKTIQRELQTMVVAGLISRVGERRWTQYSIR